MCDGTNRIKSSAACVDTEQLTGQELLKLYKETGEEGLKWDIVLRYEHVVKCVAMQVRGIYSGFTQTEDIINEGLIALLKSIDKFDPDKGVKFETYISKRIRGMVIDLARKQDWVPRNVRKRAKEIDEAVMGLANDLGHYPTSSEVAKALCVSEEKYQKEVACIAMDHVISLEALMDAGEYENIRFEIPTKDLSTLPDHVLEEEELKDILTEGIRSLKQNEQIVLGLYYVENLRLKDIAHVMGVSEPRISQLHTRAIGKLRKHMLRYFETANAAVQQKEDA